MCWNEVEGTKIRMDNDDVEYLRERLRTLLPDVPWVERKAH